MTILAENKADNLSALVRGRRPQVSAQRTGISAKNVALGHTTASLAISAAANVQVVQRLVGYVTGSVTLDRYGHLLQDDYAARLRGYGRR
ncbi:hypothetical protein [Mycobacterium adipatum]|jgi:site-specific recombinase XerD|uniref:hypothetical protein n=1 Tax=Mycobacterium adipatum TaxID=1682113 RepID=UPI003983BFB2